jgi:hypothetical protein
MLWYFTPRDPDPAELEWSLEVSALKSGASNYFEADALWIAF